MDQRVTSLGFSSWPFPIVPDSFITKHLCGRPRLRAKVEELLGAFSMRDSTMVNLVWSDNGAGKTHTLKFIQNCAIDVGFTSCYFVELPDRPRSFVDIHNTICSEIGLAKILDLYMNNEDGFRRAPILTQLCRATISGVGLERFADQYLRGLATPPDARRLGLPHMPSTEHCVDNLTALIQTARAGTPPRTIVMLDEFQRISNRSARVAAEIQSAFSSVINRCPTSLSLILSFVANPSANLPPWFENSLRSRAGVSHFIPITTLTQDEAMQFFAEILVVYGPNRTHPLHPFTEGAVRRLISISGGNRVLPRDLLANASYILERHLSAASGDDVSDISEGDVRLDI